MLQRNLTSNGPTDSLIWEDLTNGVPTIAALASLCSDVLARPEVFVGQAAQKFDSQGLCTDTATRSFVTAQMQALGRLVAQHRRLHDSAQIPGLHD